MGTEYNTYFPVALNLKGRRVVVIGGDGEATMKIKSLLPCAPELVVVSPTVTEKLEALSKRGALLWIDRAYEYGDLEGAFLAIVCDPEAAKTAHQEASEKKVVLNVLDQTEFCDFIAVANFSRDGLQIGIHSSGKSAALSRRIRERLEKQFGDAYAQLTRVLGEVRPTIKALLPTHEARRAYWLDVVNEDLLERVDRDEICAEELKKDLLQKVEKHITH